VSECSLLLTQIDTLHKKLAWLNQVLDKAIQIESSHHEQLSIRFGQIVSDQQRKLEKLRDIINSTDSANPLFTFRLDIVSELDQHKIPVRLYQQFQQYGKAIAAHAQVQVKQAGSNWTIVIDAKDDDAEDDNWYSTNDWYSIKNENGTLCVYLTTEPYWKALEGIRKQCTTLFVESLSLLGGLLIRHFGLDQMGCKVADALCRYLCDKAQLYEGLLVIPAIEDSFTNLTNIIRIRFPSFSIWSLPIVAHEFGHYLQTERRDQMFPYLFSEILQSEGKDPGINGENDRILQEQFADLFAVYSLGPAYICTCIMLDFDPCQAHRDRSGHPSDAQRVYFVLQALQKIQAHDYTGPYGWVLKKLRELWVANIKAAGMLESLTPEQTRQLNNRLDKMYKVIDNPAKQLVSVRYDLARWNSKVQALRVELESLSRNTTYTNDCHVRQRVNTVLKTNVNEVTLPDVLNAAWLCRLLNEQLEPDIISKYALMMCDMVPRALLCAR
jgi:hypothetical protein